MTEPMEAKSWLVGGDVRPVPDPTRLTTEQLRRELAALREIIETRLDGMDTASALRLKVIDRIPADTTDQIMHLADLVEQRFAGIALQFSERDIRTDQASRASKEALDAALQAAKELVGAQGEASAAAAVKSETSFTKQIDQIGTIIQTMEKAMDARITELKERIDRGEGNQQGSTQTQVTQRASSALAVSVIVAVLLGLGLVITVVLALARP